MEFKLTFISSENFERLFAIMKDETLSKSEIIERFSRENPGKVKDLGILQANGKVRKTNISMEGVETKEVELIDALEDLTNDI